MVQKPVNEKKIKKDENRKGSTAAAVTKAELWFRRVDD
jgi:hypothetical protein